jgi:hypothetical protein
MMTNFLARLAIVGAALSITTSAQAADVAAPSAPAYSGVIEMFGGYSMFSGMDEFANSEATARENNPILGGFAAVNVPLSDGMSVQLDLLSSALFAPNNSELTEDEMFSGNSQLAVHVNGRSEEMLFGAFGGAGQAGLQGDSDAVFFFGGAEIQAYLGSATLYLQGGYLDSYQADDDDDDALDKALFARGIARLYASETSRLSTEVAYANGTMHEADDIAILGWGARFDQQISESPASMFLAYNGNRYDLKEDCGDVGYEHRAMVGLSFAFGGNTIMANDRQGVALDTKDLGPWVAIGEADASCGAP